MRLQGNPVCQMNGFLYREHSEDFQRFVDRVRPCLGSLLPIVPLLPPGGGSEEEVIDEFGSFQECIPACQQAADAFMALADKNHLLCWESEGVSELLTGLGLTFERFVDLILQARFTDPDMYDTLDVYRPQGQVQEHIGRTCGDFTTIAKLFTDGVTNCRRCDYPS
ncbi:unnamed protein product [Vitrella brassicaformis CCMP3155]|uniref:Uncharacterized protein n=2 Tax=Vitrella brassicaformis TaxID=1169539 RepID=A0A0G4EBP4_VITBC|nr:unnamed protein product [Vitrella brassicaformis CCMP3155]|eukprot:CEL93060.1 unnamed protein product [Vitrella brassicaformis CCMP3155]